jgi:lipoate-protein ligase A
MKILVSPFQNPYLNLALEDFFLREQRGDLPLLFFYVNRPCVVLGRFQNPWLESNLSYLAKNDLWLVRRQSFGLLGA